MCSVDWPTIAIEVPRTEYVSARVALDEVYTPGRVRLGTPVRVNFTLCPICGTSTTFRQVADQVSAEDALRRINRARFDAFYEVWDRDRTGPDPDEVGREEGRREAREIRALERALELPPAHEPKRLEYE